MKKTSKIKKQRIIGLELLGAKNNKSAISIIDYYPDESKLFLIDLIQEVEPEKSETNDQALLRTIKSHSIKNTLLSINAPTTLPPFFQKNTRKFSSIENWVKSEIKLAQERKLSNKTPPKLREFTPYTQRPVEIWLRYNVIPNLPKGIQFDVDETFGGSRAPIAARMHFLSNSLKNYEIIEVLPKLSVIKMAHVLKLGQRHINKYRHLDLGKSARVHILNSIADELNVFIYENDFKTLSKNLNCFDAFISGLTGYFFRLDKCQKPPRNFPLSSGWVTYPKQL